MSRLIVHSDNLGTHVELFQDDAEGWWSAYCAGCGRQRRPADDLLVDSRARFTLADAVEQVGSHVDCCTRCADPDCRNTAKHDAGHRCRKN